MTDYYVSDPEHQLEINLEAKRKELIAILDFCEQKECKKCLLMKCKCNQSKPGAHNPHNETGAPFNISNEPCTGNSKKVSPQKTILTKPKLENGVTTSTPEKKTVSEDIEKWMGTSKLLQEYKDRINQRKSLVTIESIRPADLPLRTLQRSSVLNSSNYRQRSTSNHLQGSNLMYNWNAMNGLNLRNGLNYVNNTNDLDSFLKHFKQSSNTKVVYSSSNLGAAYNKQVRPTYSYF